MGSFDIADAQQLEPQQSRGGKGRPRGRGRGLDLDPGTGRGRRRGRGGRRSWEEIKERRAEDFPPGPANAAELGNWPSTLVHALLSNSPERIARLQSVLARTVQVTTDYSGFECPREGTRLTMAALRREFPQCWPSNIEHPLKFVRSCDNDEFQQSVLCNISRDLESSEMCVLQDIMDRLPTAARGYVRAAAEGAASSETATSKASKCEANRSIWEWVMENSEWIFDINAKSRCLVHEHDCSAHKPCTLSPAERPLKANIGGPTCLPHTSQGKAEGEASTHDVPHTVWIAERAYLADKLQEDIMFLECTPRYPVSTLRSRLRNTHMVFHVVDGPELHGWPHRRMRILAVCLNLKTIEWKGPTGDEEIGKEYSSLFHRATTVAGDIFMLADHSERVKEYRRLAAVQGWIFSNHEVDSMPREDLLRALLPPGGMSRFRNACKTLADRMSLGGKLLFDCDHNIGTGPGSGSDWPCSLRHGSVFSLSSPSATESTSGEILPEWKLAVPSEYLSALGFLMHDEMAGDWGISTMEPLLRNLSAGKVHTLVGNGMHLVTQSSWMFYIYSNIIYLPGSPGPNCSPNKIRKRHSFKGPELPSQSVDNPIPDLDVHPNDLD